jgi:ABC-type uncharacterized transport system substrate-binding protein
MMATTPMAQAVVRHSNDATVLPMVTAVVPYQNVQQQQQPLRLHASES